MPIMTDEEEHQTWLQLQRTELSTYFTLTAEGDRDNPLDLRNLAFGFIRRIAQREGTQPRYWFAVCLNPDRQGPEDPRYHVHGFLDDLDAFTDIQKLRTCWRKSIRKRDRRTGERKNHEWSIGRSDFQRLTGDPYVFEYVISQAVLAPCTNVAHLKPDSIRVQVEAECWEVEYAR
jgi:hypothetical protein